MGAEVRVEDAAVGTAWAGVALDDEPTAFEFAQAVRLLERLYSGRAGPGRFVDPAQEVVRFSAHPSLAFPASHIQALELPEEDEAPARMSVNFFGLIGPSGVLPQEYTRLVADRVQARDGALAAFLDLFNHRAISLLYRAWRRPRFDVARERGESDRLQEHMLDLVGEGLPGAVEGRRLPAGVMAGFVGLLGPQRRSAAALEQLVEGVFQVPVEIQQFVGGWFRIEDRDRCELGAEDPGSGLGVGAVAGDEVWDSQARVRIRMGPLGREDYDAFLPGGRSHTLLRSLTRFFAHDQFEFEVQLVLRKEDVPGCTLGAEEPDQRLGWSTWVRTRTLARDAEDTVLLL